ncbi:Phosphoethanolamine transferase for glucans (OPG), alkaline phosphatase superfamily [Selenomonas sp. WCT3]|nr:Phosphoethanolamine transferase for glucans (OPG), alkaline phosphatase superfamily [Selenomonas ruminantium]
MNFAVGGFFVRGKAFFLKVWARMQQAVELQTGVILGIFGLNFFSIVWQNIHMYKAQQLPVLAIDAIFLLAGVVLFVMGIGLIPQRKLRWGLWQAALVVSAILGALECFSIYNYQTLVGAGIITALLQTNFHEAGEFLRMYVGWKGAAVGVGALTFLAAIYRYGYQPRFTVMTRHNRNRLLPAFLLAGLGAGICLWQQYHSFVINDSLDIPAVRVGRAIDTSVRNIQAFEELKQQAAADVEITENDSDVPYVVFILGESTNRDRLHLYGYPLDNTPNLDELSRQGELAVFRDTISPQGATVAVLRELFTFHDVESDKEWYRYNNLIDVMRAAGYKTYWLSNQESSGIWGNVAQLFAGRSDVKRFTQLRESHEDGGRLDEELFPLVDEALQQPAEKNFYVLHLMGGHGLYYMRFPYLFTKFTKDDIPAPQKDLSEEKRTEIAQYENAMFYNDFVVSSLLGKFQDKEAIVIYLPDHGETIYDNGSNFAGHVEENPNHQQLEVPLIFWASPKYREKHPQKWQAVCAAVNRPYMTDDMIHTIMDLLGIRTAEFNPAKSVINPKFDGGRKRIVRGKNYDTEMK